MTEQPHPVRPYEPAPGAPAGWYPLPGSGQRYWDGAAWTGNPLPAHTNQDRDVTTAYAWTVALLPIALAVLVYTAPEVRTGGMDAVLIGSYVVLATLLCWRDSRALRDQGIDVDAGWAVFIPGYLFKRTAAAKSTPAIPIVWFASIALYFLASYLAPGPYEFDDKQVESDIASQFEEQTGSAASVDCPKTDAVVGGDIISCDISSGEEQGTISVTFADDGSYSWLVDQ